MKGGMERWGGGVGWGGIFRKVRGFDDRKCGEIKG